MDTLYAPGPYYRRIRTFLREFKPPKFSGRVNLRNAFTFAHASLQLGVIGRERSHGGDSVDPRLSLPQVLPGLRRVTQNPSSVR